MGFIDNSDVLCQVKYMLPFLVLRDYFRPLLIELLCSLFVPRCNFRLNFFLMVPVSMTHLERLVNFKHVFFFLTIGYKNITFLPPFDSCKTFMITLGFFVVPKVKIQTSNPSNSFLDNPADAILGSAMTQRKSII